MREERADNLINLVMSKVVPKREKEEQLSTYASGLWKLFDCPLRAYYDRIDPVEQGTDWFMVAAMGDWTHEGIQDFYKRAGLWLGDEVRGGSREYNISYREDVLIRDPYLDAEVPVEIKSVSFKKFKRAEKEPIGAHILQLQMYLHFHKPEPYPFGYIHYVCRDEGQQCAWRVYHDPELCSRAESLMASLELAVESRTPPRGERSDWNCRFCDYRTRCYE